MCAIRRGIWPGCALIFDDEEKVKLVTQAAFIVELEHISKSYEQGQRAAAVLKDVDLRMRAGEALAIMGPSGSGKTTLLNIIGGLDRADGGRALLEGRDLAGLNEDELAKVRNRRIGFVFQSHHLLPQCTVWENVLVPGLAQQGRVDRGTEIRAKELLERVGLSERLEHFPGQLSGGERQRVAVVRALVNQPGLLLADEPTGALDQGAAEKLAELLVELNRERRVTLIVATHWSALAQRVGQVRQLREGVLGGQEAAS